MFTHKIKQPKRPTAEASELQQLFDAILLAAKAKSIQAIQDYFLDEGLDISKLHIYADTILSRMAYESNMHKIDILNADMNHEFNRLIHTYRQMLDGTMPPLMPAAPAMSSDDYAEIPADAYKREIMVGLLKRGDMQALTLDVMDEKFYLACCGRFGLSDVVGWLLVVSLDTKIKNLGFHITQFSEVTLDTASILNYAIYGYALGGFVQKVQNFLSSGADIDQAMRGYAEGGFATQVNHLCNHTTNRHAAVKGYIASGIFQPLEALFLQDANLIDTAVYSLKSKENCYYMIFTKIAKTHPEYQRILAGRKKAVLRIISPLNNADLRQQFLEKISKAGAHFMDLPALLENAQQINEQLQAGKKFDEVLDVDLAAETSPFEKEE